MKRISLLFLLLICLFITGCNNVEHEVKSLDDFMAVCENNYFTVTDKTSSYCSSDYIDSALLAKLDTIDIEMIIYSDVNTAIKVQENQFKNSTTLKNASTNITKDKGKNYYKFTVITNGYYTISSRIDNTIIFTNTTIDKKDIVDNIFDELGY